MVMTAPIYLPDRKQGVWIETNPFQQAEWSSSVNRSTGGRFKPLVKMFNWWRRENPTGHKRPKGIVIENSPNSSRRFFTWMHSLRTPRAGWKNDASIEDLRNILGKKIHRKGSSANGTKV